MYGSISTHLVTSLGFPIRSELVTQYKADDGGQLDVGGGIAIYVGNMTYKCRCFGIGDARWISLFRIVQNLLFHVI